MRYFTFSFSLLNVHSFCSHFQHTPVGRSHISVAQQLHVARSHQICQLSANGVKMRRAKYLWEGGRLSTLESVVEEGLSEEVAQWLTALTLFQRIWPWFPAPPRGGSQSSFRGLRCTLLASAGTHTVQRHTSMQNVHIRLIILKTIFFKCKPTVLSSVSPSTVKSILFTALA